MGNNIQQNFNTISNIFIIFLLLISSLVWADSNGIWNNAEDLKGGVIGNDEQMAGMNYTFINPVYFGNKLFSLINPSLYFIDIGGRTQLNNVSMSELFVNSSLTRGIWSESSISDGVAGKTTASGKSAIYGWAVNENSYSGYFEGGEFYVNSNISFEKLKLCNGNLAIDSTGKLICGTDNVNDADNDSTNELQNLDSVLGIGNDAGNRLIINVKDPVNNQDVATKKYVDDNSGGNLSQSSCYWRSWGDGYQVTAICDEGDYMAGIESDGLTTGSKHWFGKIYCCKN